MYFILVANNELWQSVPKDWGINGLDTNLGQSASGLFAGSVIFHQAKFSALMSLDNKASKRDAVQRSWKRGHHAIRSVPTRDGGVHCLGSASPCLQHQKGMFGTKSRCNTRHADLQSQGVTEQQASFTLTKCILAFKVWTERMVRSLCVWSLLDPSNQTSTACYSFTINIWVLEPSTRWQDTRSAVTVISQIEIVALQACTEKQELPFPKARPIRKANL